MTTILSSYKTMTNWELHHTIMEESKVNNREKRWSLNGMTALVTGGTRGIGCGNNETSLPFSANLIRFNTIVHFHKSYFVLGMPL